MEVGRVEGRLLRVGMWVSRSVDGYVSRSGREAGCLKSGWVIKSWIQG